MFKVDRGEPYFKLAPFGRPLVVGVENYQNRNWKQFPKVVVSGNWFPMGEELEVIEFNPAIARAHHEVIRSFQVDSRAIYRAVKAHLFYVMLLSPEGHNPLTTEEIDDWEGCFWYLKSIHRRLGHLGPVAAYPVCWRRGSTKVRRPCRPRE